jgi:PAS domain S-box-containing protein
MIGRLQTLLFNPKGSPAEGLEYWRERILVAVLGIGALISVFALAVTIPVLIRERAWPVLVVDSLVFLFALAMLFLRRIRFEVRATAALILGYAVGVAVTADWGFLSSGPLWLFTMAVLAGVLLGLKAALAALCLNAIVIALLGWLQASGSLAQGAPFFLTVQRAIVAGASFILMNGVAAASCAVLIRALQSLAQREKSVAEGLDRERARLVDAKLRLESEIGFREETERRLRESESRYRLLAENASDVIWTTDMNLRVTYVSPSVERVRGYTPDEVMRLTPEQSLTPDSRKLAGQVFLEEMAREHEGIVDPHRSRTMEIETRCKDGSTTWSEVRLSFLRDAKGKALGILGVGRNITERRAAEAERKKLEARLEAARKLEAIATLAGGIAHQFNNALSAVTASVDLLDLEGRRDSSISNYMGYIRSSAQRMTRLTSQLVAYARGGKYQAKAMRMGDFMRETIPLVTYLMSPSVRLQTELAEDTCTVKIDPTQMQMVLSAVLENAFEAIEGEGTIRIACGNERIAAPGSVEVTGSLPGVHAVLTIEDSGRGMDEETRRKIFDPFFTTKFKGRGLGMAAAYGIVKNHDGWISVESEPGRGTILRVYLPAIGEEKGGPVEPGETLVRGSGNILLIEDEDLVLEASRLLLEKMGYRVLTARTGAEALEAAGTFDGELTLAILDIALPDMDGETLYPLLSKARPQMKVLVCSGYSLEGHAENILNAGAQGFIRKPFTLAALSQKIKKILAQL